MLDLAFERARRWPGADATRRVVRAALRRQMPAALVDRPKHGFVIPDIRRVFQRPEFLDAFRTVLEPGARVGRFLRPRAGRRMLSALASGRRLPPETEVFAWNLVFLESWCRQVEAGSIHAQDHSRRETAAALTG